MNWKSHVNGLLWLPLALSIALSAQQTVTTTGGTVNVVPKYSGSATIINSAIFENGGKVGIGTTSPSYTLTVNGTLNSAGTTLLTNAFRFYSGAFDGAKTYIDFRAQTSLPNLVISAPGNGGVVFNYDHGTGGAQFANGAGGILAQITAAGNAIFAGTGNSSFAGNLGIGTTSPSQKLTVVGVVQSTTGGFQFPDNTVQTTAAKGGGLASVSHDSTLTGNGTSSSPLGIALPVNLVSPPPGQSFFGPVITVQNDNPIASEDEFICPNCSGIMATGAGVAPGVQGYGGLGDGNLGIAGPGGTFTGGSNGGSQGGPNNGGNGVEAYGGDGAFLGGDGIYAEGGEATVPPITYGDAGYFNGNVTVTGSLSKSSGSFKIDHPLDPANKYLLHSFVESPDMMNIYNGNVVTDSGGMAIVTLPDWFEALNRDFRYQLTVIGQFAQAIVASEIQSNQFTIRTDKPSVKVSWQVTGIRQDAWANAHRIPIEEGKSEKERGYYLHPELYNEPVAKSVQYATHPQLLKRLQQPH